jgi:hypothetical protein
LYSPEKKVQNLTQQSGKITDFTRLVELARTHPLDSMQCIQAIDYLINATRGRERQFHELCHCLTQAGHSDIATAVMYRLIDIADNLYVVWLHWSAIRQHEAAAYYALKKFLPTIKEARLCDALYRNYGSEHPAAGRLILARQAEIADEQNRP